MVMMSHKFNFAKVLLSAFLLALICLRPLFSQTTQSEVSRNIDIISVEHKGDRRIRIYFSATEKSGDVRYPMTTIERNMVSVNFKNTSTPPVEAKSLAILGSQATNLNRALFVAFNLDKTLTAREVSEVRSRVSELISDIPSQYLTVAALAKGSARVIADTTPEKNDNINRIQQQIAALATDGEGPVMSETLCAASDRFNAWGLNHFKQSDQKILVIVSPSGDAVSTERFRAENCWRSLVEQGVRVYHITFGQQRQNSPFKLDSVIDQSKGFVHEVSSALDILAAAKNIVSILNNEYVLDVDAPDISLEDQPLELSVKVAYHDAIIQSEVHNLGFVIPTLASVFGRTATSEHNRDLTPMEIQEDIDFERKIKFGLVVLGIILAAITLYGIVRFIKKRSETQICNTCSIRVRKDYADCSFRAADCISRLVIISGPLSGRMIPLHRGPNRISVFARQGIKLPFGGVRWFNHGTIVIDGQRVTYTPKKSGIDLINGWPVVETRMLGQGHILKVGSNVLRFEIKPQSIYH